MEQPVSQSNNKTGNLPIGWFVLFSLLLHVVLLWGVLSNEQPVMMPAAQQPSNGFHITLSPYQVPMQHNAIKQHNNQVTSQTNPDNVVQKPAQTTESKTATPQATETLFRERILSKLRQSIAAHFVYPLLARQRNWQGEVLLAFRLERDGRISDARIARSSGYGLLDHAALNALAQVKQLDEVLPHNLTVELPIIYRLEG